MYQNRLSIVYAFETEEDSEFTSETISFVDVWISSQTLSMAVFLQARLMLLESLKEQYDIKLQVLEMENGSVTIHIFGLDQAEFDHEKVLHTIGALFLKEIDDAGYTVIARGLTSLEFNNSYYGKSSEILSNMN